MRFSHIAGLVKPCLFLAGFLKFFQNIRGCAPEIQAVEYEIVGRIGAQLWSAKVGKGNEPLPKDVLITGQSFSMTAGIRFNVDYNWLKSPGYS